MSTDKKTIFGFVCDTCGAIVHAGEPAHTAQCRDRLSAHIGLHVLCGTAPSDAELRSIMDTETWEGCSVGAVVNGKYYPMAFHIKRFDTLPIVDMSRGYRAEARSFVISMNAKDGSFFQMGIYKDPADGKWKDLVEKAAVCPGMMDEMKARGMSIIGTTG